MYSAFKVGLSRSRGEPNVGNPTGCRFTGYSRLQFSTEQRLACDSGGSDPTATPVSSEVWESPTFGAKHKAWPKAQPVGRLGRWGSRRQRGGCPLHRVSHA